VHDVVSCCLLSRNRELSECVGVGGGVGRTADELGGEQRETLEAAGNLACSYIRLERYEEAVDLGERVLEVPRKVLGPEDVLTARTMGNLALSYERIGQNPEVLELNK
jgi:hypothetical protein